MVKRGIIHIFLLLALVLFSGISVHSEVEQISDGIYVLYNDTMYNGQKVDVEDKILSVNINPSYQATVDYDGKTIISGSYNCVKKNPYEFCLYNISYDDYGNLFAETEIKVYVKSMSITRDFEKTNANIGEVIDTTVMIENNGYGDINNFTYREEFPYYIVFYSSDDMNINGNFSTWTGNIKRGDYVELEYSFYSENVSDFEQKSVNSFFNGYNTSYYTTDTEEFSFNHSFGTQMKNTSLTVGETSSINTTLYSPYSKDVGVEVMIYLPENISFVSSNKFIEENNQLYWSGTLEPRESKTLSAIYKAEKTGEYKIKSVIEELQNQDITIKNIEMMDDVSVSVDEMEISTNIDSGEELKEETTKQIALEINNPNGHTSFQNILFKARLGNISIKEETIADLESDTSESISFNLDVPTVMATESKVLNFSFEYETEYGQKLFTDETASVSLKADDGISIIKTFSNTSLIGNETLNISVTIKNTRGVDLEQVLAEEVIPSDFKLIKGLTKKSIPLDKAETVNVYSYLLKVPDLEYDQTYNFETNVLNELNSHLTTYTNQKEIFVKGRKGPRPPEPVNSSGNRSQNGDDNKDSEGNNGDFQTNNNESGAEKETLINDSSSDNTKLGNNQEDADQIDNYSQKEGGAMMLFVFYIPLAVLILFIILFLIGLKMKFISLSLPKIIILPRNTAEGQAAQGAAQQEVPQNEQVAEQQQTSEASPQAPAPNPEQQASEEQQQTTESSPSLAEGQPQEQPAAQEAPAPEQQQAGPAPNPEQQPAEAASAQEAKQEETQAPAEEVKQEDKSGEQEEKKETPKPSEPPKPDKK